MCCQVTFSTPLRYYGDGGAYTKPLFKGISFFGSSSFVEPYIFFSPDRLEIAVFPFPQGRNLLQNLRHGKLLVLWRCKCPPHQITLPKSLKHSGGHLLVRRPLQSRVHHFRQFDLSSSMDIIAVSPFSQGRNLLRPICGHRGMSLSQCQIGV